MNFPIWIEPLGTDKYVSNLIFLLLLVDARGSGGWDVAVNAVVAVVVFDDSVAAAASMGLSSNRV